MKYSHLFDIQSLYSFIQAKPFILSNIFSIWNVNSPIQYSANQLEINVTNIQPSEKEAVNVQYNCVWLAHSFILTLTMSHCQLIMKYSAIHSVTVQEMMKQSLHSAQCNINDIHSWLFRSYSFNHSMSIWLFNDIQYSIFLQWSQQRMSMSA